MKKTNPFIDKNTQVMKNPLLKQNISYVPWGDLSKANIENRFL